MIAPVDGGPDRLLPRDGAAAAAGEEPETVLEARHDVMRGEGRHTRRRKLDRKGHALETPADRQHRGGVGRVHHKPRPDRAGPIDEKPSRIGRVGGGNVHAIGRHAQRRHLVDVLGLDIEAFPAGGDDGELRAADEQVSHYLCRRFHEVLTVVEHQQPVTLQSADQ